MVTAISQLTKDNSTIPGTLSCTTVMVTAVSQLTQRPYNIAKYKKKYLAYIHIAINNFP